MRVLFFIIVMVIIFCNPKLKKKGWNKKKMGDYNLFEQNEKEFKAEQNKREFEKMMDTPKSKNNCGSEYGFTVKQSNPRLGILIFLLITLMIVSAIESVVNPLLKNGYDTEDIYWSVNDGIEQIGRNIFDFESKITSKEHSYVEPDSIKDKDELEYNSETSDSLKFRDELISYLNSIEADYVHYYFYGANYLRLEKPDFIQLLHCTEEYANFNCQEYGRGNSSINIYKEYYDILTGNNYKYYLKEEDIILQIDKFGPEYIPKSKNVSFQDIDLGSDNYFLCDFGSAKILINTMCCSTLG